MDFVNVILSTGPKPRLKRKIKQKKKPNERVTSDKSKLFIAFNEISPNFGGGIIGLF